MTQRLRPVLLAAAGLGLFCATACTPDGRPASGAVRAPASAEARPDAPAADGPSARAAASESADGRPTSASPPEPAATRGATRSPDVAASTAPPAPPAWPRAGFAGLSFAIPPDWTVVGQGDGIGCAEPRHSSGRPRMFGCSGLQIKAGSAIAGYEGEPYAPGGAGGWYAATDVQPCPVRPATADGSFNGVASAHSAPVESGLRPVGARQAWYDRWGAGCRDGSRFSPRAWYLPLSRVLFLDYTGHAETGRILGSVRFPG